MKKNGAQAFAIFSALFVVGFLFQPQVFAAKIVSGGATKYYVQVKAEKGDSPYSIARLFVDSNAAETRNPTEVAADFLALNGIRAYNKKGNPLIYPGEIYLVPTQEFYKAMSTFIANLDAQEKTIAPAMAVVEAKKSVSEATYLTLVSQKNFILGGLVLALLVLFICFVKLGDRVKMKEEEVTAPVARAGEPLTASSLEESLAPLEISEESPSPETYVNESPRALSAEEVKEEVKAMTGGFSSLAPLESPAEGITLGHRIVNALRPYTMEEVAGVLETDVIPVLGNNRSIKLRNLPESFKKHPEWRGEPLHNIITRAEMEAREKKREEQVSDDTERPHPSYDHRGL